MGQRRNRRQSLYAFDFLCHAAGDHPPVPYENNLLEPILALEFCDFLGNRRGILRVAGKDFHSDWTAFLTAKQTDDHLFMSSFFIAIVAESHDAAVLAGSLEITAGDVVEDKMTILKML